MSTNYRTFIQQTSETTMPSRSIISEEAIEDIRMISGFDRYEIIRLHDKFYEVTEGNDDMCKEDFLRLPCILASPLRDYVAAIFGFSDQVLTIEVKKFIAGVSKFNCPLIESRQQKIKIAFRLQDIDGDGIISKADIMNYLNIVTARKLEKFERDEIAMCMLEECSTDQEKSYISFNDFQRVIGSTDFQTKLRLPI